MPLTPEEVISRARELYDQGQTERGRLDEVRRYWMGRQHLPAVIPAGAPAELKILARMSRVNIVGLVVESLAQSLAVEGFRGESEADNADVWGVWQANKLDARQAIIHRAALAYGVAYAIVTPGEPVPVIRGISPRELTTLYDDDEQEWPAFALERRLAGPWRLYDGDSVYRLRHDDSGKFEFIDSSQHEAGVTPVIRYLEVQDPDWQNEPSDESLPRAGGKSRQVIGQVAGLMTIQDQIDLTTFDMFVVQHFAAFPQKVIIGWLAPSADAKVKLGAETIMTFEGTPEDVSVSTLAPASLDGYLNSRESSFRQAASLSQTPAHELIGEMVNISAEALAAAEAGRDRKVADRQTTLGEGHEQMLGLVGRLAGFKVPEDAQVIWRDTTARSLAATVDAITKLAVAGIPIEELLDRIPGMSQQDVQRLKEARQDAEAAAVPPVPLPIRPRMTRIDRDESGVTVVEQ